MKRLANLCQRTFFLYLRYPLGKPVEKTITDYHIGGTADRDLTMAYGMEAFSKGPVYGGMMKSFQKAFGDSMVDLPTGKVSEVDFGKTCSWAGVTFEFRHGASTDFPAASIIIGGKVYYTHWVPAKAHVSNLQVSSRAAVYFVEMGRISSFLGKNPVCHLL